ncbi:MAG TPA: AAA family ATPase, partial [Acidobacteriota bacterium]|nr:AAA family ATPase [Acidobacteriota bacterium]
MLFLDRIEILGFKSFCDKTLLKVPEGITAIVGPNGCGKSNVVDALNWVLGEQSAKSLRSDKMEEVIFNGSKNRKPLGMAQVTLFWRTERENPAAGEVSIARRLFRSGESQYEMNGEICRLKDIHQFFLNEGFDPLAYSILEQGKIESFFSSKPMERRALIEEVAGVAEFKHKKRAAQLKLAENQLQLERIQDILVEVEKQLSSLKRQAAKARRHQILKEERKILQQISYYRRFHQIQEDFRQIEEQLRLIAEAEEEALQSLQQKELVLTDLKLRFTDLESKLYQDQARLHQLELQIQENQSTLVSKTEHIQRLTRIIEEKEAHNGRLIEEEKQLRIDYEARTSEQIELHQQLQQLAVAHDTLVAQLGEKTSQVEAMENSIQQFRNEIVELLHNTSHLKSEQTRLNSQQEHLSETIKRKEGERITANERRAGQAESLSQERAGLATIVEEIGYLDQTETDILRQCAELKVEWDALQAQVQKAFQEQSDLQREFHKLEAQQHSSKFYNESAKNLLNLPTRRALGMMMDFIETAPQYETALEHFLADKLNYLIVNEEDSALASIDYLKRQGLGYCSFIIKNGHHPEAVILPDDLRSEIGVIGSLQEIVRIKDEALPAIAPFLKSAVVVDDLDCAQVLIKKYPDYQFVTVQGDVILSPALYAGGAKADDIPGLMAIQREVKELTQQLETATENIRALDGQVRSIQDRLDTSNRELSRLNDVRESKKKDRLLVQLNCEQIEKELGREDKLVQILDQEILQLDNEREAVQARADQFVMELQQQTAKREARETERTDTEQKLVAI